MNFYSSWDKIKYSISENADTFVTKSKDLLESSKLKYAIHTEENNIEELYTLIGEELYKHFRNENSNEIDFYTDTIKEYCTKIKKIEKKIKKFKKELDDLNQSGN